MFSWKNPVIRFFIGLVAMPLIVLWMHFTFGLFLPPPVPCTDFCRTDIAVGFTMVFAPLFGLLAIGLDND